MRAHKNLDIWMKIMAMIEDIYTISQGFPRAEMYGLTAQIKRAAVSVASNIAEGAARRGNQEKIQFFSIARGSLSEIDAQLEISLRLKFLSKNSYDKLQNNIDEISRMLEGLTSRFKKQSC
jgi:four helix bundle protein